MEVARIGCVRRARRCPLLPPDDLERRDRGGHGRGKRRTLCGRSGNNRHLGLDQHGGAPYRLCRLVGGGARRPGEAIV